MRMHVRIRPFCFVNAFTAVVCFLCLALLTGCWVTSLNGLEEKGMFQPRDKDIAFDLKLMGQWQVTSDNCTVTLTVSGKEEVYDLSTAGQGSGCDESGKKVEYYQARLLNLDGHLFLDVSPRPGDVCEMCLPLHWIFLTKLDKDTLSLLPINDEWLKHALEKKIVTLETMPGETDQLTASSKDLKAFCRQFAGNPEAFSPIPSLMFKRKTS